MGIKNFFEGLICLILLILRIFTMFLIILNKESELALITSSRIEHTAAFYSLQKLQIDLK